jgi:hypothetical protein
MASFQPCKAEVFEITCYIPALDRAKILTRTKRSNKSLVGVIEDVNFSSKR